MGDAIILTPHKPGPCPVKPDTLVECVLRDGSVTTPCRAEDLIWGHTWHSKEITGYREVAKPISPAPILSDRRG